MTTVRVHLDTAAAVIAVGTARVDGPRGAETTEFAYDDSFVGGRCWEAAALDLAEACGLRTPRRRLIVPGPPTTTWRESAVPNAAWSSRSAWPR